MVYLKHSFLYLHLDHKPCFCGGPQNYTEGIRLYRITYREIHLKFYFVFYYTVKYVLYPLCMHMYCMFKSVSYFIFGHRVYNRLSKGNQCAVSLGINLL